MGCLPGGCNNMYRRVGEGHADFRKLSLISYQICLLTFSRHLTVSVQQLYGAEIQALLHSVVVSVSADCETENRPEKNLNPKSLYTAQINGREYWLKLTTSIICCTS